MTARRSRTWRVACVAATALAAGEAQAADGAGPGTAAFAEHCVACHDVAGTGVVGFAPPLAGPVAARLKAPGGRSYLAQVVVFGITGVFEQNGMRQLGVMPSFAALPDEKLAAALNHVVSLQRTDALPGGFAPIASAEIAAARAAARTPHDLHRAKQALERAAK